ncbi:MAG: UvrD-helicase domain-containing protein [Candidatus Omnitrophota bacterium]|jgi:ATP-dependent helicase/nuclease subunit A
MMILTEAQKKAVQAVGKNILVSAGAGTGKTRVLVERILHLLRTQKATITELLVLTFTEKAANEIKTRLSGIFREWNLERPRRDLEKAAISTFHGFALRLLREHPVEAGVDPDFRVIETEQSELLKEEAMREVIAKLYDEKNGAFELLPVYGEGVARNGILKVFTAARHEGKNLREFFLENEKKEREVSADREKELSREAEALIAKLKEIDGRAFWQFFNNKKWDWGTFRTFREWSAFYAGKRKTGWKEWRMLLEDLAALRMELLAVPWKEKFKFLALTFEAAYSAKKKEKGFLDFDDLQTKIVELFRGEKPSFQKLRERYQREFKFILVDEFQDTNFLQMEFVELLSSGSNLFMVGDYKQSIYGFRGAEPGIFLAKEKLYGDGAKGERIFLSESFRNDPPVLDFVNRFFKTLWAEDGFPFEPLLFHHVSKDENAFQDSAVEVLVTRLKENEDMNCARLREARTIAARIRELHEKDKIPYGDMAVLFQAMTLSGIYENAFKSTGVPYFIVAGRGFYEQPEIQDVMSFLSHLEQPFADIPLAATLRSPFFHITDDTLFWLSRHAKAKNEDAPLRYALKALKLVQEILPEQRTRLETFLRLTRVLGELKDRIPLSELIDKVLESTGYELSVLMDPKGMRRYANLKKLIAMVREYETYERMTLAAFLNILKRLKAQEVRESEAQITLETSVEAVRMMSVHAAKGLEFPVVFVADMGNQGSRSDSKAVIAHAADGYAMQVPDEKDSEMQKPYFFRWVDGEIAKRDEEEWKRLFYVAVTRAKSRLFLSGVYRKKKEEKKNFREMDSWMDWAMAICGDMPVLVQDSLKGLTRTAPISTTQKLIGIGTVRMSLDSGCDRSPRSGMGEDPGSRAEALIKDIKWKESIPVNSEVRIPSSSFPRSIDLPVSAYVLFQKDPKEFWRTYQIGWTVGENEGLGESAIFSEDDFSAADFGTAMHGFFEHLDLERPERFLEQEALDRVFGRFGEDAKNDARKIVQNFIKQPIFCELQKARQVKREIDFVLNERRGLIHGKIDILFQDSQGEWHILDYKTASGDEETARKSAYDLQLEIYAIAAERILKLPVRSAIIYYLRNQKAVTLSFPAEKSQAFFDGIEKKIRNLQQKILDYSNERMTRECELKEGS